ncbi:MAG TPA: hypothetical protein VE986_07150 [Hyphomicrobiales bacterium]|nr:hypothetical protein [Hyphomicrobiales bacterium]
MIPTLEGRWQTRALLFILAGLPVTFFFALYWADFRIGLIFSPPFNTPFKVLIALFCVGFAFDLVYIFIQSFRWDRDWPFVFQFLSMIFEFGVLLVLINANLIPGIPPALLNAGPHLFYYHFALVFIASYVFLVTVLQVLFVRWRYKGGEIGRFRTRF